SGMFHPFDVSYTERELKAAVDRARELDTPTAIHVTNPEAAKRAIRAGASSIEHGLILDDEAFGMIVEAGVAFVPTVWLYEWMTDDRTGFPRELRSDLAARLES